MTPAPNKPAILAVLAFAALGFGWAAYVKYVRKTEEAQQPPPPGIEHFFMTDTSGKVEKTCPADALTFFVIGQSHAANSMKPPAPSDGNAQLLNYFNGRCYLLADPILGPTDFLGSLWPTFAQKLHPHVNKPIVIMSYAFNGTFAAQWLPGEPEYGLLARAMAEAKSYTQAGGTIEYVIYDQGQRDAMDKTPKETYIERLKTIFDHVQEEIPGNQIFLIHSQSGCTFYNPPQPYIIEAQAEFAAARTDTRIYFNSDTLDDSYRHDLCHFNDKGRAVIADKLVEAVLKEEQKN